MSDAAQIAQPFLTVLIPVFNGQKLIQECIKSVLDQPCKDLQVLVVDDGSTDATASICHKLEQSDERISFVSHTNYGLGKNRNEAFALVKGECLIFLDHDDLILPGFYTAEMKAFIQKCFFMNIDTIVPARLRCNENADRAIIEKNGISGVFPGYSDASWRVQHEFASIIYSTKNLISNNIRFSETRPEMETIFRHKAVLCSDKVLFTNLLWFSIRRENPLQITKNWDALEVSTVRMHEYSKLMRWYAENNVTELSILEKGRQQLAAAQNTYVYASLSINPSKKIKKGDIPDTILLSKPAKILIACSQNERPIRQKLMLDALRMANFISALPRKIFKGVSRIFMLRRISQFVLSPKDQSDRIETLLTTIRDECSA